MYHYFTVSLPQGYKWSLTDLPNLFTTFKFFIFGDLSADDRRLLVRYITAYNGFVREGVVFIGEALHGLYHRRRC